MALNVYDAFQNRILYVRHQLAIHGYTQVDLAEQIVNDLMQIVLTGPELNNYNAGTPEERHALFQRFATMLYDNGMLGVIPPDHLAWRDHVANELDVFNQDNDNHYYDDLVNELLDLAFHIGIEGINNSINRFLDYLPLLFEYVLTEEEEYERLGTIDDDVYRESTRSFLISCS